MRVAAQRCIVKDAAPRPGHNVLPCRTDRPVSVTLLTRRPGCIIRPSRVECSATQRPGVAVNSIQNPAYQAGMDARFAIAARHSRMVRVLRVAVPAAVILAMTAILFVSIFNPFRMLMPKLPIDMGNLVVSGSKITMESPHLSGYTP